MTGESNYPAITWAGRGVCICPDCRPCSDARCMEIRRREHLDRVSALPREEAHAEAIG